MTSMPAQVLGLKDRGQLREGYWGDIVIFDPERVADTATYENPKQYPKGIDYVLVNGAVVIDNGQHTGARAGKVVYGPGYIGG
jgi:N-acyl-D-aspartate/D-glutamate deacylase